MHEYIHRDLPSPLGLKIHEQHFLQWNKTPHQKKKIKNEGPGYAIKQSDDEAPVMLKL